MITYVYRCPCGHKFEHQQSIIEDALSECPKCHKNTLVKIIQQGNFSLKGAGWFNSGGY